MIEEGDPCICTRGAFAYQDLDMLCLTAKEEGHALGKQMSASILNLEVLCITHAVRQSSRLSTCLSQKITVSPNVTNKVSSVPSHGMNIPPDSFAVCPNGCLPGLEGYHLSPSRTYSLTCSLQMPD